MAEQGRKCTSEYLLPGRPSDPGCPLSPFGPNRAGKPGLPFSPGRPGGPPSPTDQSNHRQQTSPLVWHSDEINQTLVV